MMMMMMMMMLVLVVVVVVVADDLFGMSGPTCFLYIFRVAFPRKSSRSSFRMAEDGHPKCTKSLSLSSG